MQPPRALYVGHSSRVGCRRPMHFGARRAHFVSSVDAFYLFMHPGESCILHTRSLCHTDGTPHKQGNFCGTCDPVRQSYVAHRPSGLSGEPPHEISAHKAPLALPSGCATLPFARWRLWLNCLWWWRHGRHSPDVTWFRLRTARAARRCRAVACSAGDAGCGSDVLC